MRESGSRRTKWLLCALLGAAVLTVYARALQCGFVEVDDGDYVTLNANIQHGLNWESIRWAFTTGHVANWHPLTWISYIVDYQLYGSRPMGHHLTSLLLHLCNVVLLFLLVNRMTGALGCSAWVAAIFALHPLRVESVVWVAERKDVLSTFFWMLAVGAYVRYVGEFKVQSSKFKVSSKLKVFYGLSLVFFALGLMAKSMVVTLPFILLLLDYWPLGRLEFGPKFSWRLILEKIPFLALAAGSSVATFAVQDRFGAVTSPAIIPLGERLANVPVAYIRYLGKIFWPSDLGPFYGFEHWRFFQVTGGIFLLGGITAVVIWQRRARPYLAVGWFWFLGMLIPTIGLVQVGQQSMADRYSYLPSVGISIMVAWGVRELVAFRPWLLKAAATLGLLAVAACAVLTPLQIVYWKTPEAFFGRAADTSEQDFQTCYNVGCATLAQGNFARAERCFERALKVAGKDTPSSLVARAKNNLGCALLGQGEVRGAIANFKGALVSQPEYPQAYYNLGRAFMTNRQPDVAAECIQHALALDPNAAELHSTLADALAHAGHPAAAINEYSKTLQLRPGLDEAANNLAWLLATCSDRSLRDGAKALTLARQASDHSHSQNPVILATLAAAYAETGQRSQAVATALRARALALFQNNQALARMLEAQAQQYQAADGGTHP
jgi:tetratricopeptide (TPR) repeat protein